MIPGRRVRRSRKGGYELRLPAPERELITSLAGQLRSVLTGDDATSDPAVRRLFPTAYATDPDLDAEYRELVHDDLLAARLAALDVVAATVGDSHLDEDQLQAWMGAVNDFRLVIGTRLDVGEDGIGEAQAETDAPALTVYHYLSYLLEAIVDALSR